MKEIKIDVKIPPQAEKSYPIIIKSGILGSVYEYLEPARYAVITDTGIAEIYGKALADLLASHEIDAEIISFKPGEKSKTRKTKERLEDAMFDLMFDRSSKIISLGGGVVGDIAGFTASTYMRGIPVIQIPTTLLAMVDSSIGGKTAVNHPLGKNLIGTFCQPEKVLIDPDTLCSLPEKELLNGMSEIIKHGIIRDESLFRVLEEHMAGIIERDPDFSWGELIETNCRIKADVVMSDEKESGVRKILNFGHTVGHALETLSQGRLTHGEAVSIGMAAESVAARNMGILEGSACERIIACIALSELPISFPDWAETESVIEKTRHDKKAAQGSVSYSLPDRIGNCLHGIEVEDDTLREALLEINNL
ncbi:3-dehydroquinate synthase [Planctomycetota bacterium]